MKRGLDDLKYWLEDNQKKVLVIIISVLVIIIAGVLTKQLLPEESADNGQQTVVSTDVLEDEGSEEDISRNGFTPEVVESLGIDISVVAPESIDHLEDGFYIVGPYTDRYNELDTYLGFFETHEARYEMTGIESDEDIIYKRFKHVIPVEGHGLEDFKEAMTK